MSTAGRPHESTAAPSDVAAACRDAGLVRLVGAADGDALAATGLIAGALSEVAIPFQASVTPVPTTDGTDRDATEADAAVTVGAPGGDLALTDTPTSAVAHAVARELGADPDPVLALAGVTAAGRAPGEFPDLLETAESAQTGESAQTAEPPRRGGIRRRAGVAIPTGDLADGLAHTTLAHAPFSGDPEAAESELSTLEDRAGRRVASLLALATVGEAPPRAAEAVERALRPYVPGGPYATVGGYADVLDAVARERPGTGLALVLGYGADDATREEALAAWRDHAARAHASVRQADTSRHAGIVVARADGPVGTVARLLRDFRSPEPVVLTLSGGEAAAAAVDRDVDGLLRAATSAGGGECIGRGPTGFARDIEDREAFVAALREAL